MKILDLIALKRVQLFEEEREFGTIDEYEADKRKYARNLLDEMIEEYENERGVIPRLQLYNMTIDKPDKDNEFKMILNYSHNVYYLDAEEAQKIADFLTCHLNGV